MIHDSRPLAIAPDDRLNGDCTGYELAEQTADSLHARLMEAEAELKALKAGMIQRVGQRFVSAEGETWIVVEKDAYAGSGYFWRLRSERSGIRCWYDSGGQCNIGNAHPDMNLIGPAPDEHSEDKKEAQRIAERNRELIAEFAQYRRLHELSPGDDVRELPELVDDGSADVCWAVRQRIRAEVRETRVGATFYGKLRMRGCEFLPLTIEGTVGDVAFIASYLPGFSFRGEGLTVVYEVEVR